MFTLGSTLTFVLYQFEIPQLIRKVRMLFNLLILSSFFGHFLQHRLELSISISKV